MKKKNWYNIEICGVVWYSHLTEERAVEEAIRARRLGIGMAYVVRSDF